MLRRLLVLTAIAMLLGAACATETETEAPEETQAPEAELSLEIGDVPASVGGNVVEIPVEVEGVEIVAADEDTSGDTGHFHVFIDRDPVAEGETVPMEEGIVHSAANPIQITGLEVGEHTFTVVVGDGKHTRIHADLEDEVTVTVEGPTVQASAPATAASGEDVEVEITSEGFEVVAADGDASGDTGHYHVLIDPEEPPKAGDTIAPAVEGEIIHTTESTVTLSDLEPGAHTIWVAVGDGNHAVFDPPVMDKLTVTVSG